MAESRGYVRIVDEKGSINICHSVVAVIAAAAAVDVDGVYGLYLSPGKELTQISSRKGTSKGVKINVDNDGTIIDIYYIAEIGYSVNEVGASVQKAVISAVEEATGLKINTVNIHICGVSLKKSKKPA
ncbi:MAG: Asp23/Gls24 family envelope stress response protein [Oscillospiraceae bacterium]|jgi:uncharacterized alkaline shock family protein YloU|nr:Asp23/Gls24 family envelope stress response protein [Oscillospiraceae bacterium]